MHFQTCYGGEVNEMIIINTIIGPGNEVPMERVLVTRFLAGSGAHEYE